MLTSSLLDKVQVAHGFCSEADALPEGLALPQQVHGVRVVQPCNLDSKPADGLWVSRGVAPIGVRTADCIPVLLAHPDGVVAAIHAGWRGVAAHIVEQFLQRQDRRFGRKWGDWRAALGPAAGGCCYEVGPEVLAALGLSGGKQCIDLRELLRQRLEAVGVAVDIVGPCTICSGGAWASYRRDGQAAGRNVAWIAPRRGSAVH
ncbi:MAG: laccase domain-containing protein [Candidatus Dadabacteria bacterium]|nr:MAG: laccase domain-containing protein [Candidatus Dadabacteria bacterium]